MKVSILSPKVDNLCEKILPKSTKIEKIRTLIGEPDKMYKLFWGYSLHRTA